MKRVVDYDRLYDSRKLESLPDELRTEYSWLLGIAGPNGSFDWSVRRIWAAAYTPIRASKTVEDVGRYLDAFLEAGLLLRWEQDGKTWGYFVGSDKPGRLPRDSWKKRFAKARQLEPEPPAELLHGNCTSASRGERELVTEESRAGGENGAPLSLSLSLSESLKKKETPPTPLAIPASMETTSIPKPKQEPTPFPLKEKAKPMPPDDPFAKRKAELKKQFEDLQLSSKMTAGDSR